MKIKEGFRMRKLGRDHIVVAEGLKLVNFNKMIVLNESAAYLWENIQGTEFDAGSLGALLQQKYTVSAEQALADAQALVDSWTEVGIVE